MKRMMLTSVLFCGFAALASAQSSGSTGAATGGANGTSAAKSKKKSTPSATLDNRKVYPFSNGQRSTPTGAEASASGTSGGYAAIGKDTTPHAVGAGGNTTSVKTPATKRSRKQQ